MKKGTAKAMRYIVAGSALTLCVIMTGCGESVSGRKSISGDKQYRYGCG